MGSLIVERVVDRRDSELRLSLRTGCFCNPGAGEAAFHLSKETLRRVFHEEPRDTMTQRHEFNRSDEQKMKFNKYIRQ